MIMGSEPDKKPVDRDLTLESLAEAFITLRDNYVSFKKTVADRVVPLREMSARHEQLLAQQNTLLVEISTRLDSFASRIAAVENGSGVVIDKALIDSRLDEVLAARFFDLASLLDMRSEDIKELDMRVGIIQRAINFGETGTRDVMAMRGLRVVRGMMDKVGISKNKGGRPPSPTTMVNWKTISDTFRRLSRDFASYEFVERGVWAGVVDDTGRQEYFQHIGYSKNDARTPMCFRIWRVPYQNVRLKGLVIADAKYQKASSFIDSLTQSVVSVRDFTETQGDGSTARRVRANLPIFVFLIPLGGEVVVTDACQGDVRFVWVKAPDGSKIDGVKTFRFDEIPAAIEKIRLGVDPTTGEVFDSTVPAMSGADGEVSGAAAS
jgi:hypothetical protein